MGLRKKKNMIETNYASRQESKIIFSRIEELRTKKNIIETRYASRQESKITVISYKISQDELDSVTLERSIASSSKRMLVTVSVCFHYSRLCVIYFLLDSISFYKKIIKNNIYYI